MSPVIIPNAGRLRFTQWLLVMFDGDAEDADDEFVHPSDSPTGSLDPLEYPGGTSLHA